MRKPKNGTDNEFVLVLVDDGDVAFVDLPPVAMRIIRHLYANNEEMRRQIAELEASPAPKQKRTYKKRDNGGDVAVAVEGSP